MQTHQGKAKSYETGRPEYPTEIFDYLYSEAGYKPTDTIADIGSGTGKVTRHFLDRGSKVIAIELDADMLEISDKKLGSYPNYTSYNKSAEATSIPSGTVNHIFCGNSFNWFDRSLVAPG